MTIALVQSEGPPAMRRLGFLAGKGVVTAELKMDFAADIESMFCGGR